MARLYRFWMSLRARSAQPCNLSGIILLLLSFGAAVQATPVTFLFQGEIVATETVGAPNFNLPSNMGVGADAELRLTFEPIAFPDAARTIGSFTSPGGHANLYPTRVISDLGGTVLEDELASLFVEHDPLGPGTPETPADILEHELIAVRSTGVIPSLPDILWHTDGGFANLGSALNGGEDLSDPEVWNRLPIRSVRTTFRAAGDLASFIVTAEFGNGVHVPEPSTASCAIMILMIALPSYLSRRRR